MLVRGVPVVMRGRLLRIVLTVCISMSRVVAVIPVVAMLSMVSVTGMLAMMDVEFFGRALRRRDFSISVDIHSLIPTMAVTSSQKQRRRNTCQASQSHHGPNNPHPRLRQPRKGSNSHFSLLASGRSRPSRIACSEFTSK